MSISVHKIDARVEAVYFTRNSLIVDLKDGRSISVPLSWYPRLLKATSKKRAYTQGDSKIGFLLRWHPKFSTHLHQPYF